MDNTEQGIKSLKNETRRLEMNTPKPKEVNDLIFIGTGAEARLCR